MVWERKLLLFFAKNTSTTKTKTNTNKQSKQTYPPKCHIQPGIGQLSKDHECLRPIQQSTVKMWGEWNDNAVFGAKKNRQNYRRHKQHLPSSSLTLAALAIFNTLQPLRNTRLNGLLKENIPQAIGQSVTGPVQRSPHCRPFSSEKCISKQNGRHTAWKPIKWTQSDQWKVLSCDSPQEEPRGAHEDCTPQKIPTSSGVVHW